MFDNPGFEKYYRGIYGDRWPRLRESLTERAAVPYEGSGEKRLTKPYYLDGASVLAASSLRLPEFFHGETEADKGSPPEGAAPGAAGNIPASDIRDAPLILDACAAPGGKTLVLASRMRRGTKLLANEFSTERRRRLTAVLDKYLPPELRIDVKVSGFDAAAAAGRKTERGRFAAVLLDAPCSGEAHVLGDPGALSQWTEARPRFLVRRQWALLSAAFLLLAPGGSLVYATCAINPEENDGVARRLMEKYRGPEESGLCFLDPPDFAAGEATEYGRLILPDVSAGMGPMYVARFGKKAEPLRIPNIQHATGKAPPAAGWALPAPAFPN
jgi:16S rRNA (cytosine1407-C5)-methyltransferase